MKDPEIIGVITTITVVVIMLGFVYHAPTVSEANLCDFSDPDTYKFCCGRGTFHHESTNTCELYPELIWNYPDGEKNK